MQEHDCEEAFALVNLLQVCALCDFEWPIRIQRAPFSIFLLPSHYVSESVCVCEGTVE